MVGIAIKELSVERQLLRVYHHPATRDIPWFANARIPTDQVEEKLALLAPLYARVATGDFPNLVGDSLEVIVFKALVDLNEADRRHDFLGSFSIDAPKNRYGRFIKIEPPTIISGHQCTGVPDFFLSGYTFGHLCIECKNLREWIYPTSRLIKELLQKALQTRTIPVLVARRIHYTTIANLFTPAGIMAHESYYQYYPSEYHELAAQVVHKRSLGFSDVRATEQPDKRTLKFFMQDLGNISERMAARFNSNRRSLSDYVDGNINLAQLYNAIGSPAAGNWVERGETDDPPF